jgi:predicted nucleotide-binding protein (sugar kinase/HSP70/actin superfamily)
MAELLEAETPNVICVQPFGCLPNHITGKGVVKELRLHYCGANISTLDYDPGTTEVNQLNRIKLLMATALRRCNCNHKL